MDLIELCSIDLDPKQNKRVHVSEKVFLAKIQYTMVLRRSLPNVAVEVLDRETLGRRLQSGS
jgi:hypothetical protein